MDGTVPLFRVFVSSTFNDLRAERDALHKWVFPALNELCTSLGARFQAVDLRWGISDEAGYDQRTMKICLTEIARCQETTERPNFIVLLGNRYGWRPLPTEIPYELFERIRSSVPPISAGELERWYDKDLNAKPPTYVLRPRIGEYRKATVWKEVEQGLLRVLIHADRELGLDALQIGASATHQEISLGALSRPDSREHVHCFVRNIIGLPQGKLARDYLDLDEKGDPDAEAIEHLEQLKRDLRQALGSNVQEYASTWTDGEPSYQHLGIRSPITPMTSSERENVEAASPEENLCQDVYKALEQIIVPRAASERKDALQSEFDEHEAFRRTRDQPESYIERRGPLNGLIQYIAAGNPSPLAVIGRSGSGKSALLAHAVGLARQHYPNAEILARFIGSTPGSSQISYLLESLSQQICRGYGRSEAEVPSDYIALVQRFPEQLSVGRADKPLIVFLDALDQLSDTFNAHNLSWLPEPLPQQVRLIVSTSEPHACADVLRKRLPSPCVIELGSMSSQEGEQLLNRWLELAGRTLQDEQRKIILERFAACGLPLFLRLVFEECCRWASYDALPTLGADVPGQVQKLFARLAKPENHGKLTVARSLGFLAAARNGLSDEEVQSVLSRDSKLMDVIKRHAHYNPPENKLPPIVWSRFYYDIKPYTNLRTADRSQLVAFFHRQVAEAAKMAFLAGSEKAQIHRALADYFVEQPTRFGGGAHLNLRKLSELPFQQRKAGMWDELEKTLCNLEFIEAKCAGQMVYDLVADYIQALQTRGMPAQQKVRLRQFGNFVRSNANVLARHPELTSQQAYNEPNDSAPANAARKLFAEQEGKATRIAWLNKPQTISRCVATLIGHTDIINSCDVFSDDKRTRILSASSDKDLKIWDAATGKEILTLHGHGDSVEMGKFSPDGERVASGARNGEVKIWDATSGKEVLSIQSGTGSAVPAVAFSPDGKLIACGFWDSLLRIWDTSSGNEIYPPLRHSSGVFSCVFSPKDGTRILTGANNGELRLWETYTGNDLGIVGRHEKSVGSCAFSHDGRWIFSASEDHTLARWNVETRQLVKRYEGHMAPVWCLAVSTSGSRLISGSQDHNVIVWDVETGRLLARMTGHTGEIWGLAAFDRDRLAVSAAWDFTLKIWDLTGLTLRSAKQIQPTPEARISQKPHAGPVIACTFSPDGRDVAAGSNDGSVRIWGIATGLCKAVFPLHDDYVLTCSFSPDGSKIVSGALDGSLSICDSATGTVLAPLEGHSDTIRASAFDRSGTWLISCSRDQLQVWDLSPEGAQRRWEIGSGENSFLSCSLSPEAQCMLVARKNGELAIWNVLAQEELRRLGTHAGVLSCAWSPDGKLAASVSADGSLKLWSTLEGRDPAQIKAHPMRVEACNFSPDSSRVVTASWDHTVKIWNTGDLKESITKQAITLEGHTDQLQDACFSPNGRKVASASMDGTLRLWDAASGAELGMLATPAQLPTCCTFSPDGARFATASHQGAIKLWDGVSGRPLGSLSHGEDIRDCAFAPDGGIVSAAADGTIKVWRTLDDAEPLTWLGHSGPVQSCRFSPNGRTIASGSWDGSVKIWDARTATLLADFAEHRDWVQHIAFSRDGKRLASCANDKTVRIWDLDKLTSAATLVGHTDIVSCCEFSPDGCRLVSGSADKVLKVWDMMSGAELHTLSGHGGAITSCAFSPDGNQIVSASRDCSVRLWNPHNGAALRTLAGHQKWVWACAFSRNGDWLLSASQDQFLVVWNASTGCEVARFWTNAPQRMACWHPSALRVATCDTGGDVYLLEIEGIKINPEG